MFSENKKKKLNKTHCKTEKFSRLAHAASKIFIPKSDNDPEVVCFDRRYFVFSNVIQHNIQHVR